MKKDILLPILALALISAVAIVGFNAINKSHERDMQTVEILVGEIVRQGELGGLVNVFQEIFPEGLVVGEDENWQIITDSSDNLHFATSTGDSTFYITPRGVVTISSIEFATGTTNYAGDFNVKSTAFGGITTLFSDDSTGRIGIGTSTPSYQLEVSSSTNATLALTSLAGTNDISLLFNNGFETTVGQLTYDDSASKLIIATSTVADYVMGVSAAGVIDFAWRGGIDVAGNARLATTTAARFLEGGNVVQISVASSTLTKGQVCSSTVILVRPADSDIGQDTLTWASGTDMMGECLQEPGDSVSFVIRNNATATLAAVRMNTYGQRDQLEFSTNATETTPVLEKGDSLEVVYRRMDNSATTSVSAIFLRAK